jgi:hypothetical protein
LAPGVPEAGLVLIAGPIPHAWVRVAAVNDRLESVEDVSDSARDIPNARMIIACQILWSPIFAIVKPGCTPRNVL